MRKLLKLICTITLLVLGIWYHNVEKQLLQTDKSHLKYFLPIGTEESIAVHKLSYTEQLRIIKATQSKVIQIASKRVSIPQGKPRRLKHLHDNKGGLCYDRSFAIEIVLEYLGFETRHISLFEVKNEKSLVATLFTREVKSHAATEVLTTEGWLLVDPDTTWLGIGEDQKPHPFSPRKQEGMSPNWLTPSPHPLYQQPAHLVYGLYSRHGKFFPPYNMVPDYNFSELLYNFSQTE